MALYGSNLSGFTSVPIAGRAETDWKAAVLTEALEQARAGNTASWYLSWDDNNHRLIGELNDLPGLASRYKLNNPNGDMQMVYGIIFPDALPGADAGERYAALKNCSVDDLLGSFRFLSVSQFNRDFLSLTYIPNDQRELRVLKVDQDGKACAGAEFGLYRSEACTRTPVASGVTDAEGMMKTKMQFFIIGLIIISLIQKERIDIIYQYILIRSL